MTADLGILAGGGGLPRALIEVCRKRGRGVFVLAIEGHTDPATVEGVPHAWVRLGALGEAFSRLKTAAVHEVVFVGAIRRPSLASVRPDARGAAFLARLGGRALGDDGILRAIAAEFEREGLHLCGVHEILADVLVKPGNYGALGPDAQAEIDLARGLEVAKGLGALDVGQGAVVQDGIVLAVEAAEGTDAMLARCADLRREGPGGVLVKVCKPGQDRRLDLPTVGTATVEAAARAGLRGIGIEAGAALILDAAAVARKADELGLFVTGLAGAPRPIPLVYLVAGEPSGDVLGARLMAALKRRTEGRIAFAGVGGESMAAEGLVSLFPQADVAVMGFAEVVARIPRVMRRLRETVADIEERKPRAVVTIDSLGFNGRLAKALKTRDSRIPRIHYVAPMVWAWKPGRAKAVAERFDHLMCLLGFEPAYFTPLGLATTHVGHPVVEAPTGDGADFRVRHGIAPDARVLCLLPGSRHAEVARMLPVLGRAAEILAADDPDLCLVIPTVATVADEVRQAVAAWPHPPLVIRGETERWNAFAASDGAVATSGSVSLELARARVPFVIGYRTSALSAWLAKRFLSVRYATLLNHVMNEMVVPEFLQSACTAEALAGALAPMMRNPEARTIFLAGTDRALAALAGPFPVPSDRAAEVVLSYIQE